MTNQVSFDANDVAQNKAMGILSYFGILVLIPLLGGAAKTSPYARFHANQGLVLLIGYFVASILSAVVAVAGYIVSVVLFVFFIMGVISAAKGTGNPLPLIGGLKLLK